MIYGVWSIGRKGFITVLAAKLDVVVRKGEICTVINTHIDGVPQFIQADNGATCISDKNEMRYVRSRRSRGDHVWKR